MWCLPCGRAIAQSGARDRRTRTVLVDGKERLIQVPSPSPGDWRQIPIYFLMLDRFNNTDAPPNGAWNRRFDFRQGGTFKGVQARLDYLAALGIRAIWISPVLKNAQPEGRWNYHGYGAQDFLTVDGRFASDGQSATAERELAELVDEAHARELYVVLDVVLNHAAEVFDYVRNGQVVADFVDRIVMDAPLAALFPGGQRQWRRFRPLLRRGRPCGVLTHSVRSGSARSRQHGRTALLRRGADGPRSQRDAAPHEDRLQQSRQRWREHHTVDPCR